MIYGMKESAHVSDNDTAHTNNYEEVTRTAMACINKELSEAVITAIEAKNPVDGYREAVEMIEDTFEDMDASMIEELFKASVLKILRARVDGLMSDAKRRGSSDDKDEIGGRGNRDLKNIDCLFTSCDSADCFVCKYIGVL